MGIMRHIENFKGPWKPDGIKFLKQTFNVPNTFRFMISLTQPRYLQGYYFGRP
jgi:hypothetical protein